MFISSLLLAAELTSTAHSPPAEDLMVEFARAFCLVEQDRLAVAGRLVPSDWIIVDREEERDRRYGTDAPLPLHDRFLTEWRGNFGPVRMWLRVRSTDYADNSLPDHSSATFGVSPDTAVDLASLQRRVPITLEPWRRYEGRAQARIELGDYVYPAQPRRYGWLQHYVVHAHPLNPAIEITARQFHGEEFPQQLFDMTCSTNIRQVWPR